MPCYFTREDMKDIQNMLKHSNINTFIISIIINFLLFYFLYNLNSINKLI